MSAMHRTVLVTGAAKRIGRAIALDLAAHGWSVAVHYMSSEREARGTAADVAALGVRSVALAADLRNEKETAGLIDAAVDGLGPLGALINNAAVFEKDDALSATRQSWDRHMEVNLRAPFVLAQQFTRALPEGAEGAIVNILDQRVLKPAPTFLSYGLSKAGLHWLTTTLAQALAPHIRVNAVGPGPTLISPRQSEADFRRQTEATILGRGAGPGDVCAAVRYLLEARAVTGQMIAADGGQHLAWKTPDVTGTE